MTVSWIPHRFVGGILALDTANTVVLRGDATRAFDHFADAAEIARFAEAASIFRAAELGGRPLAADDPHAVAPLVLSIRETTDRLFRGAVEHRALACDDLAAFLRACADDYGLAISGLMCIPPFEEPPAPHFALLAKIAARNGLTSLSMGMSADFATAVRFGATHVRVGTAIFGGRTTGH